MCEQRRWRSVAAHVWSAFTSGKMRSVLSSQVPLGPFLLGAMEWWGSVAFAEARAWVADAPTWDEAVQRIEIVCAERELEEKEAERAREAEEWHAMYSEKEPGSITQDITKHNKPVKRVTGRTERNDRYLEDDERFAINPWAEALKRKRQEFEEHRESSARHAVAASLEKQ